MLCFLMKKNWIFFMESPSRGFPRLDVLNLNTLVLTNLDLRQQPRVFLRGHSALCSTLDWRKVNLLKKPRNYSWLIFNMQNIRRGWRRAVSNHFDHLSILQECKDFIFMKRNHKITQLRKLLAISISKRSSGQLVDTISLEQEKQKKL